MSSVANVHVDAVENRQSVRHEPVEAKWPLPYAAMFMVTLSALLWYAIIQGGSALLSII